MNHNPHSRAELQYVYGAPETIAIVKASLYNKGKYTAHRFKNIAEAELIAREILLLVQQADLRR